MKKSKKKVLRRNRVIKVVNLMDEESLYVGIDVHKRSYSIAIWSNMRNLIDTWTQPAVPAALIKRLTHYRSNIKRVVYEAGPTGYGLVRALRSAGFNSEVIAPSKTPRAPGKSPKADRLDSKKLAEYAFKDLLKPIRVPTEVEEIDRQVIRLRHQLVRKNRRVKQQIKSLLLQYGVEEPNGLKDWADYAIQTLRELDLEDGLRLTLNVLIDELVYLKGQLKRVTKEIKKLSTLDRHREKVDHLRAVAGVGLITAMTYKTELLAPERFDNEREVAHYAGFAPYVEESGETRKEGPTMKSGNRYIRSILIESAWGWVFRDPVARAKYCKLLRNTTDRKKAVVAMARRLAILLWRMLIEKQMYYSAA